ncbi:MAG: TonB-dependent receptor, partial [Rhodothermaceae bacterium]|nr:TonB-dependent receptor [Rhodothermaceae bacterium]
MKQRVPGITCAVVLGLMHLLIAASVSAQSGKITGIVTDEAGEAMVSVNVVIVGTTRGGSTDQDGRFFILNVEPGTYELRASFIGFRTVTQSEVVVNINKTTTIDFVLEESTTEGDEILVIAVRPDVQVDQ